jgi:hypothetical protein
MTLREDTKVSQTREPLGYRTIAVRWSAMLAPLAAAFGQQQLAYYLVQPACGHGQPLLLHLPPVLALAITAWAVAVCWREVQRAGGWHRIDEPSVPGTGWFFGSVGLLLGGISLVLILAQWLPTLFIPACRK